MSIREAAWTSLVWTARALLYPVHSVFRILARLARIVAAIAPLVGLVFLGWWSWQEILDHARFLVEGTLLPGAVAFLIAIGLFAAVLSLMGKLILAALQLLGDAMMKALRGDWHPGWKVRRSFMDTWHEYVTKVPGTFLQTFWSACLVALVTLAVGILAWAAYPRNEPEMVDRYVVVVDATGGRAGGTVKEVIKVHLRTRTVFSLTYLNDAQPQEGIGICLEDEHKAWLRMFREAIVECVQIERARASEAAKRPTPGDVPTFDVVGFASVAPMQSSEHDSAELNCDVANRRADAVGGFLADEEKYKSKWDCETVRNDFKSARKLCAGEPEVYDGGTYKVRVRKWSDRGWMQGKKPADDGALPNERRYRIELLNRAVHITVPQNFCQVPDSTTPQKAASW